MRIGINAMVLGPRDTGVGLWTRGLIGALARVDRENEYVVYHRRQAGQAGEGAGENFRFVRAPIPGGNRAARIAWEQLALPRRVRRDGLDVLHCPAYVMPRRCRVPTVVTLHDLLAFTHRPYCTRLNVLHFRMMLPATVQRAALLHCTSHWTRGVLSDKFPAAAGRARVIHPVADDLFVPPDPCAAKDFRRARGLREAPFLFVGNVEPKKNIPLLLEAVADLKRRHGLRRKLLMVGGDGWGVPDLRGTIARLGLAQDVVRWGYVPREELPLIYAGALALVFPSDVEGFGLPPLEAMACGTPVITSGKAGLAESVGGAALVVSELTPGGLAEAMRSMDDSEDLRRLHTEAGLRRASAFRWDGAARQFVALYREAAGRRPADSRL